MEMELGMPSDSNGCLLDIGKKITVDIWRKEAELEVGIERRIRGLPQRRFAVLPY